jgi:hypothetical protein
MLYNNDTIFKEKYKRLIEEEILPDPVEDSLAEEPTEDLEDDTYSEEGEMDLGDDMGDDSITDEMVTDEVMEEPIMDQEPANYSLTDVLEKIATWNDEMDELLNHCIRGAELINSELAREDATYITKDQVTTFSNLLDSCREIFLSVNDVSFDADKLLREIDLSKKILLTKKEESVKKKSKRLKEGSHNSNYENYFRMDNTEGYTQKQLDNANKMLKDELEDLDESDPAYDSKVKNIASKCLKKTETMKESFFEKDFVFEHKFDRDDYFRGFPSQDQDYEIRAYGVTFEGALDDLVEQAYEVNDKLGDYVNGLVDIELNEFNTNEEAEGFYHYIYLGFSKEELENQNPLTDEELDLVIG